MQSKDFWNTRSFAEFFWDCHVQFRGHDIRKFKNIKSCLMRPHPTHLPFLITAPQAPKNKFRTIRQWIVSQPINAVQLPYPFFRNKISMKVRRWKSTLLCLEAGEKSLLTLGN